MELKTISSFSVIPHTSFRSNKNLKYKFDEKNGRRLHSSSKLSQHLQNNLDDDSENKGQVNRRDALFKGMSAFTIPILLDAMIPNPELSSALAVERAVGSAEQTCRELGNCLETGQWDGAVGWTWGGKDRCDATDPRCGADGKLTDAPPSGEPVPDTMGLSITQKVQIQLSIGKSERGTLNIGLYGNNSPVAVAQMLDFLDPAKGLVTTSKLMLDEGYGVSSGPVSLSYTGVLNVIYPNERVDFGVLSQQIAYAKSKSKSRIPDDFVPQPRPTKNKKELDNEPSIRNHDAAGLLSIPGQGLGYGGNGLGPEDEAFASAFQITSTAVPSMDTKERRKVIGQLMDKESMALLARLSSLPTKKGLKGIIPGQNYGPPLLNVRVLSVNVEPLNVVSDTSTSTE